MAKIIFYKLNGIINNTKILNKESLKDIHGMMTRCTLKDSSTAIGYAEVYRTSKEDFDGEVHDYINLWTWDNLDEEKHELIGNDKTKYNQTFTKINIDDIIKVEAILYSNPRWGTPLTNKFGFNKSKIENDKTNRT